MRLRLQQLLQENTHRGKLESSDKEGGPNLTEPLAKGIITLIIKLNPFQMII